MMNEIVTIKAMKYPNRRHYEWQSTLIEKTDDYVLVRSEPNRELHHFTKNNVFIMQNLCIELFSLKGWYTVSASIENNQIVSYYCNIAMPSIFKDNVISFVDLDLDLVKRKGEEWKVVDEDEFIENSQIFSYPKELIEEAEKQLDNLWNKVRNNEFPFNDHLLRKV
jgi:protein associated with RNAse G/E